MPSGHNVGTMFAEIGLEYEPYTRAQKRILKDAQSTTLNIERNFKNLGIRSSKEFDLMRASIHNSYNRIVNDAKVTSNDIIRAEKAKNQQLKQINEQQFGHQRSLLSSIKKNWIATTVAIYAAWRTVSQGIRLANDVFEAGKVAAQTKLAFTEISGSAKEADRELGFLRVTADKLGQNFWALLEPYKGVLAASKSTNIAGAETQRVFESIVKAGTTLGLSAERTKLALYAVEQMMSKGKVSSEELRRQLGDVLPGAFSTAAQAMNMTTGEFDKMLRQGKIMSDDFLPKFATALSEKYSGTVTGAVAATNKWDEAITDLKVNMAAGGFLDSATETIGHFTSIVKDPNFQTALKEFATSMLSVVEALAKFGSKGVEFSNFLIKYVQAYGLASSGQIGWNEAILDGAGAIDRFNKNFAGTEKFFKITDFSNQGLHVEKFTKSVEKLESPLKMTAAEAKLAAKQLKNVFDVKVYESDQRDLIDALKDAEKYTNEFNKSLVVNKGTAAIVEAQLRRNVGATVEYGSAIEDTGKKAEESQRDLLTWTKVNEHLITTMAERSRDAMSDIFFGVITGELDSLSDIWDSVWKGMLRTLTDMLAQMLVEWVLFQSKLSFTGLLDSLGLSGVASSLGLSGGVSGVAGTGVAGVGAVGAAGAGAVPGLIAPITTPAISPIAPIGAGTQVPSAAGGAFSGTALGIYAGIAAAPLLGPTITSLVHDIFSEKTAPAGYEYIEAYLRGVPPGTPLFGEHRMPDESWFTKDSNLANILSYWPGNYGWSVPTDSPLVDMIQDKNVGIDEIYSLIKQYGTYQDPTAHASGGMIDSVVLPFGMRPGRGDDGFVSAKVGEGILSKKGMDALAMLNSGKLPSGKIVIDNKIILDGKVVARSVAEHGPKDVEYIKMTRRLSA